MAQFTNEIREIFDFHRLVFRIGELSSMTGVSARQLRYWEQKGLINSQERSDGKQARVYTFKTFVLVSMMKYFLDTGYTLVAAAQQAKQRQENAKVMHRFITRGMRGFARIDNQLAINLGSFDDQQKLFALLPDDGSITYRLLPNAEAKRVTQDVPN